MIIYDLHCHSTFSDGSASVAYLIDQAAKNGYKTGIADHLFCDGNDTVEDIRHYLDSLCEVGIPVGGEANIGDDFLLPDEMVNRFDYLVASVHAVHAPDGVFAFNKYFAMRSGFCDTWPGYDVSRAEEYMEIAYRHIENHMLRYRMEILGHAGVMPFYHDLPYDSPTVMDWENDVIALCKKYHVAMEISSMWNEPYERMLRKAKAAGLKFSFASDAHKFEHIGNLKYCYKMIDVLDLKPEDMYLPDRVRKESFSYGRL